MSQPHPELVVLAITLIALAMVPLASRLVGRIGEQISSELDGGRTGEALNDHLRETYDGALEQEEIRQMIEARAFVRGEEPPDIEREVARVEDVGLHEEIRQLVEASNERRLRMGERPFDVEAETARRLARYLGQN